MGLRDRLDKLRKGSSATTPQAAQSRPQEKQKRVGPITYLKQMREELSKVSWPKRRAVTRGTLQVLAVSLVFVIILGAVDLGLQSGLKKLITPDAPAAPVNVTSSEPAADAVPAADASPDTNNVTQ